MRCMHIVKVVYSGTKQQKVVRALLGVFRRSWWLLIHCHSLCTLLIFRKIADDTPCTELCPYWHMLALNS